MAETGGIAALIARIMALKPVRVFLHYGERKGALLAGGLSYQAIFAVFAAIWVGFSIAGAVIRNNPELLDALLTNLSSYVPGLFKSSESDDGAIDPRDLLESTVLNWTGAIAGIGLLATALGWLASGRDAVRTMFGLPAQYTNFLLLKLKDLGLAIGFGAALLISAGVSVLSTSALDTTFGWLGIGEDSDGARIVGRVLGLLIALVFDTLILGSFYRVVSGIPIPLPQLLQGTIIGAVALGVLKALGSSLLGGATNNPLLAGFAVIIGLLLWFNFICQVILLGSAWIAVTSTDDDVDLAGVTSKGEKPSGVQAAL